MEERPAKTVRESRTEMTELVLPGDSNQLGNILGGRVMHWMDLAAAMAAARHAGQVAVTAAMDRVEFIHPVKVGQVVRITAELTWVGRSSMEVSVTVRGEDLLTGAKWDTSKAYLTFVALDMNGRARVVPALKLETAEEEAAFREGAERRQDRLRARRSQTPTE